MAVEIRKFNKGFHYPQYFETAITPQLLVLLLTAAEAAIDKWHTGKQVNITFTANHFKTHYLKHLDMLLKWEEFSKNLMQACKRVRTDLLQAVRQNTMKPDDKITSAADELLNDDFAASEH
ncbi:hypothetical protein B0H21DRAFT_823523 [Amylocystis lapponica]|nr:hypothetical protein B0H21DRAFT_823523 [Amylocystis lapponica]